MKPIRMAVIVMVALVAVAVPMLLLDSGEQVEVSGADQGLVEDRAALSEALTDSMQAGPDLSKLSAALVPENDRARVAAQGEPSGRTERAFLAPPAGSLTAEIRVRVEDGSHRIQEP